MVDDLIYIWTELMDAIFMAHQIWFLLMLVVVGLVTGCIIIMVVRR